jgi:hypothetical protein
MFAVILLATGSARHMAATASACVAAVAEGLVGHGVVVALADDRASQRLAEAIGADCVVQTNDRIADVTNAARAARGEWLLILEAGDLPQEGWIGAVERHALATDRPGLIPAFGFHGLRERLVAMAGLAKVGLAQPGPGWVLRRNDLLNWNGQGKNGQGEAGPVSGPKHRPLVLPLRRSRVSG